MLKIFHFFAVMVASLVILSGCESEPDYRVNSQFATALQIPPPVENNKTVNKQIDYIVVQKADRVMALWKNGRIIKTYPILAFGADPMGPKMREGDEKTPEGTYFIDGKHPSQKFQKFLNISYPNDDDKARAQKLGVRVGGNVGIHGDKGGISGFFQRMDRNWTDGCIAMRNADIEEIFAKVDVGTPIMIKP